MRYFAREAGCVAGAASAAEAIDRTAKVTKNRVEVRVMSQQILPPRQNVGGTVRSLCSHHETMSNWVRLGYPSKPPPHKNGTGPHPENVTLCTILYRFSNILIIPERPESRSDEGVPLQRRGWIPTFPFCLVVCPPSLCRGLRNKSTCPARRCRVVLRAAAALRARIYALPAHIGGRNTYLM